MANITNASQPQKSSAAEEKQLAPNDTTPEAKPTRWVQIRLIPIWLRIILVALLLVGALALGLMVGYGYLGEGKPADVLKWSTWQHMIDIIRGVE